MTNLAEELRCQTLVTNVVEDLRRQRRPGGGGGGGGREEGEEGKRINVSGWGVIANLPACACSPYVQLASYTHQAALASPAARVRLLTLANRRAGKAACCSTPATCRQVLPT